jgi:hypothetical protein
MTKRSSSVNASNANIVYTKHAEERMRLRRITSSMIADTVNKPDRTQIEEDGDTEFIRTLNGRKVHVIATRVTKPSGWLIKSTWVRGEEDPLPLWRQILSLISKAVASLFNSGSSRSKRR